MTIPDMLQQSKTSKIDPVTNEEMKKIISKTGKYFQIQEIQNDDPYIKKIFRASNSNGCFIIIYNNYDKLFLKNENCKSFESVCLIINKNHQREVLRQIQKNRHYVN